MSTLASRNQIQIPNLLFFIAFYLYFFYNIVLVNSQLTNVVSDSAVNFVRYGILMLILLKIVLTFPNIKVCFLQFITLFACMAIVIVSFYITKDRSLFISVLLILASLQVPFQSIVENAFKALSLSVACVVLLCFLHVIANLVFLRSDGGLRYSFGFNYSNYISDYLLNIYLLYFYAYGREKKLRLLPQLFFLLINFLSFRYTNTRLSWYLFIAVFLISLIPKKEKLVRAQKVALPIAAVFPFFCMALSFMLTWNYSIGSVFWQNIDKIFSGRLHIGQYALQHYGVSFVGSNVLLQNVTYGHRVVISTYVDSSYVRLGIQNGVLFLLMTGCLLTYIAVYSVRKGNAHLFVWSLVASVVGIVAPSLVQIFDTGAIFLAIPMVMLQNRMEKHRLSLHSKLTCSPASLNASILRRSGRLS